MTPPATAFILAGGQSRRMGEDKAALRWGDGTLLDHMKEKLGAIAREVRVVGRPPLPDLLPDRGPVEGLRTALTVTVTDRNLLVALDLPFLPEVLLGDLLERLDHGALAACRIAGRVPLCLAAHRRLLPEVDEYLRAGRRSVEGLLESASARVIEADALRAMGITEDHFRNLNTPDDYLRARP
jgi:molybdopterin-guanine dinucleotide biosynthesis protein A